MARGGLRLTKINRRLRAQEVDVPYSPLHRFARAQLDFGAPTITVRVAELPPGQIWLGSSASLLGPLRPSRCRRGPATMAGGANNACLECSGCRKQRTTAGPQGWGKGSENPLGERLWEMKTELDPGNFDAWMDLAKKRLAEAVLDRCWSVVPTDSHFPTRPLATRLCVAPLRTRGRAHPAPGPRQSFVLGRALRSLYCDRRERSRGWELADLGCPRCPWATQHLIGLVTHGGDRT
jgi:hypothetical protein